MLGIALCLLAAVAYAVGVVLQKPAVRDTPALTVTWLACTVGAVALVPFAPALVEETRSAAPESVAWMLYLGVFPTAVAFTTWAFALSRTTAGRLGSTTYLVPAIAIVLGWIILGESPPVAAILGGVIAIGGVVIARSRPPDPKSPRRRHPHPADSCDGRPQTQPAGDAAQARDARWKRSAGGSGSGSWPMTTRSAT